MNNDIARTRCPICGTQTGARINKNGIIYVNCPMGHQAKLNKPDSHAAKIAIEAGQSWNNGVVYIYPNKQQTERTENERTKPNTGTNGNDGTNRAGVNYGRPNGQCAAVGADISGPIAERDDDFESDDDDFEFGLM